LSGQEINFQLAEIFKSGVERSVRQPLPGFYVMKVKKDPRTGHFVGVATWIPRDQPLPGNLIVPEKPVVREPSLPEQEADRTPQVEVETRTEPTGKLAGERRPVRSTLYDPYDAYEL